MFFFPISVDVPMARWPLSNFAFLILITLVFFWQISIGGVPIDHEMVLNGWAISGLLGYNFLHAGLMHLLGNLLFLWVFGNAVCAKIGNLVYIPAFLAMGVAAGAAHLLVQPDIAVVGASGAINGVVGAFLILYPRNNITCVWVFIVKVGRFTVSSIWVILLWFVFDLWGALSGGGGVAYIAHLGGFAAGAGAMLALIGTGKIKPARGEQTLLDWIRE